MEQYRDIFFNELNLQKADNKDEDYNDIYKPLAGDDRYTLPSKSLHDAIQYKNKSQKPPYRDESEESLADKKQHLIGKNMIKDPLHNSNNSDTIILRPAVVNTHRTGEVKKDLRRNKQITKPITKATEAAETSTIHTITRIL